MEQVFIDRLGSNTQGLNKCNSIFNCLHEFLANRENKINTNNQVKNSKVKQEVVDSKKEETVEEIKDTVKKESKVKVDNITLINRSTCPVHVMTNEEKKAMKKEKKNSVKNKEEEHRLQHLVKHLTDNNIQFTQPVKMPTGLYELNVLQTTGNQLPITVDINGVLYSDEIKFFIGHMNPGDEYDNKRPCIFMTKTSLEALKNAQQIPERYIVPFNLFQLNKFVDLQTLREKDKKKREVVFSTIARILSGEGLYEDIIKAANGEPVRFAFCRYISENEFSIVSSKRNLLSNLDTEKLKVSKEIWINFKDKEMKLTVKSCA